MSYTNLAVQTVTAVVSVANPVLGAMGTIGIAALDKARRDRLDRAREVALAEISEGKIQYLLNERPDDLFSWLNRYGRAAMEGAARDNLRLMARVIDSFGSAPDVESPIHPDEFLAIADILASLTPIEIQLLATYLHVDAEISQRQSSREVEVWRNVRALFVPAVFPVGADYDATCVALGRTGLLLNNGGFDGGAYIVTPRLSKLEKMVRISQFI